MEEVIRKYRFGDMIFAYTGPVFTEPALVKPFRVETDEEAVQTLIVTVVEDLVLSEKPKETVILFESDHTPFYAVEDDGAVRRVYLSERLQANFSWYIILGELMVPRKAIARGGAFLHCSMINVGGKAVLFTAEKQVGKSTQAALWKQYRNAETVNGDRAMLYPVKTEQTRWFAASTPYCGTSKIAKNECLPLGAIVILSRAGWEGSEEEKATVRLATPMERVRALFDGCTFKSNDKADVEHIFSLVESISAAVPFLKLYGTLGEDSVEVLEQALKK